MTTAAPSSTESSASYAVEVARLLWPEPWEQPRVVRGRRANRRLGHNAYVFPSARRPRMLVPADLPASAVMVGHLGGPRHGAIRPLRAVLARSVRSGALAAAGWPLLTVRGEDAGADSIERHLSSALGTRVRVGVMLGTRRVTQKPVLPVFAVEGGLLGYAKVGHNDLTAPLVRREAAALAALAQRPPAGFRLPTLLHHGRWSGLEVLVQSPLTSRPGESVPAAARIAATRELAGLGGTERCDLGDSAFTRRLVREVEVLPSSPERTRLARALDSVLTGHGADALTFGGWHGDWGPWNMGMADGTLLVWDWERYDPRVPLGFDALHHCAQRLRPGKPGAMERRHEFRLAVPEALSAVEVPAAEHDLTSALYLAEIGARYVEALSHGETPDLHRRTAWVLSLLEELAGLPTPPSSEGRP
ncbi:hypothetical protein GCM10009623_27680 [Nocardioides aestuarii]|uniref:Aminoglycoside phosphotransferase domain-containing protein n=1 Tax=Nocardioides aestuarii TaxID=252231 RepID=A0ABW4TPL6_9ACTN